MATEFELKYRCGTDTLARIRSAYPGGYTRTPMTTTYYDVPGGLLGIQRWTLRHRREGERHICTLKTPRHDGSRGEWEVACDDIYRAVPQLAKSSGILRLVDLTKSGLIPLCGARFERQAKLIKARAFTAELALDSGVLTNGERILEFSEVELELKSGSREALEEFGAEFARTFDLEPEPRSKFARAKRLGQEKQYGSV